MLSNIQSVQKALGFHRGPFFVPKFGRSGRIRTPDHWFWRPALYQAELRSCGHKILVPLEGVEPPTRDLGRRRSIR